jgi:anion-transporting  ArsA/GET3 family ATPase
MEPRLQAAQENQPPEPAGLLSLVERCRVLVSVGAGGVGKTTTAAAIGLLGASLGRRTLVMTIDPARRLAKSLGLEALDQQERAVPREKLEGTGIAPDLLHAMMLDQKLAFDEVIRRHAADEQAYRRVLQNKLYHELSTRLSGGQEYAAMEKLYEIMRAGRYDLLVLDTPPTVNAFDFLEAPAKMVALVDGPAVRLFVKSYETAGKLSFKLLNFGSRYVFRRLARFVGGAFLDDVAQFFGDMHAMLDGFRQRAGELTAMLSADDVGFVVVTAPDHRSITQATRFYERLQEDGFPLGGFVVNRVHPGRNCGLAKEAVPKALTKQGIAPELAQRLGPLLSRSHRQAKALAEADARAIAELKKECGEQHRYVEVPLLAKDVHDIDALLELAEHLR